MQRKVKLHSLHRREEKRKCYKRSKKRLQRRKEEGLEDPRRYSKKKLIGLEGRKGLGLLIRR